MGTLFIVATPIGNLKDITFRAIETLKTVDVVVCEDTRVSGKLLKHLGVEKPMTALNDFNEEIKSPEIVDRLLNGQNLALVSDAGTPLVSDPGYKLVRLAIEKGIKVEVIPGPTSAIAALVVSGMPPDKFTFVGYLPKKDGKRKRFLEDLKKSREIIKSTIIAFESPYRLLKTLEDIKEVFGDLDISVCRELTKIHEEVMSNKISVILNFYKKTPPKGEVVLLF